MLDKKVVIELHERGASQVRIARMTGVSRQTIGRWTKGVQVDWSMIYKNARKVVLENDLDFLINEEEVVSTKPESSFPLILGESRLA